MMILWVFPLYFLQVTNEHNYKVCVITIIVSYVRSLITSMKDQLCVPRAPSSTVDRSTGEDNIIMF